MEDDESHSDSHPDEDETQAFAQAEGVEPGAVDVPRALEAVATAGSLNMSPALEAVATAGALDMSPALEAVATAGALDMSPALEAVATAGALDMSPALEAVATAGSLNMSPALEAVATAGSLNVSPALEAVATAGALDISPALEAVEAATRATEVQSALGDLPDNSPTGSGPVQEGQPDWLVQNGIEMGVSFSLWVAESLGIADTKELSKHASRGSILLIIAYLGLSHYDPSPSPQQVIPVAMVLNMLLPPVKMSE
ncbi:hypothetical protein ACOZ32_14055 (plasmid) [Halobacterium sp. MBLA0001]|uniref:hypothetical protein n=1 Tax=Halobacterium sp. MBLA0001 TaxID=3413511 RepID=UPI003C70E537